MKRALKIVVTGPFGAGKTAFIQTISQIDVVSTERRITRRAPAGQEETTVALDYGRVTLGRTTLSLFGTPGQKRFDFMWEILSKEMDGFVMLVDSTETRTFRGHSGALHRHSQTGGALCVASSGATHPLVWKKMSDDSSITLVTVGLLKKYVGDQERLGVPAQGRTVAEILAKLGIPSALVAIVMVEGRQVMKDYVPRAGDVVKLIPLMGGG